MQSPAGLRRETSTIWDSTPFTGLASFANER
jgi:hypothetical protein